MQPSITRSKSFKALSQAQPIKKDIEGTLNKLQQQKRRFLATQRQQAALIEQIQTKRQQLNKLKAKVPQTKTDAKRSTQTNLKFYNTDRTYENIVGNIQKLKDEIDKIRKRSFKCKQIIQQSKHQYEQVLAEIDGAIEQVKTNQTINEEVKQQIVNYRQMNIKNLNEFKKSHGKIAESNIKDDNERKRMSVTTKSFLAEERRTKAQVNQIHLSRLKGSQIKNSQIKTSQNDNDIMADSVPIAKARVNVMIHKNKQKIKIAQNYMKFGQGLQNMFKIMKQYKGRDDVDYLSDEFVKKQKQIQKLGQYIGKLQYRIVASNKLLTKKNQLDDQLQQKLKSDNHNESEKHYKEMTNLLKEDVQKLKQQSNKMNGWLKKIGEILGPLVGDNDFSRGNAINVIGKIEQKLNINRSGNNDRKQNTSPVKQISVPSVQPEDHHQKYAQLLSYEKMKQYADEYIKNKKI